MSSQDPGSGPTPDPNQPPFATPSSGSGYQPPPSGGGYQPPTSGAGYQPPPGNPYPSPGGQPTGGAGSGDDRTWLLISHFGGAALQLLSGGWLGWVAPLIAMLVQGPKSPHVRAQAVSALNHMITWSAAAAILWILGTCGSFFVIGAVLFLLVPIAIIVPVVFGIIAGIKAVNGEPYTYPATITIIK